MLHMNKLTFLSLLCATMFFTSGNAQVKKDLPKENATISTAQPKPIKLGPGNVHCSLQDKKGNLWFGTTYEGVYRYDGKSFTNFTSKDGLNSNNILSLLEDKKGNIWFGTDAGVSHYNGKTFTNIPVTFADGNNLNPSDSPNNLQFNFVSSMLEDKSGKLWFGTNAGVYCYDGKAFTRFLDNKNLINTNSLTLQIMQCMLEDKQGIIWFTTKLEGVCRYDGKSIINYKPDGEGWFRGLLADKNGSIWVGTRYKGVVRHCKNEPSA